MNTVSKSLKCSPERLKLAFDALTPLLQDHMPRAPTQLSSLTGIESAFEELHGPLALAREHGGLINPWAIAGLKRDEFRNAAALAGLWLPDFGGATSRKFLAEFLAKAIPRTDWKRELDDGYKIETESSPIGNTADRVDIVIQTSTRIVGIEVKIDAGLGPKQLERYKVALHQRSELYGLKSHIVLLAPIADQTLCANSISWREVAAAAWSVGKGLPAERSFIESMIVRFGDHVLSL